MAPFFQLSIKIQQPKLNVGLSEIVFSGNFITDFLPSNESADFLPLKAERKRIFSTFPLSSEGPNVTSPFEFVFPDKTNKSLVIR